MVEIRHILYPTDLSKAGELALRHAVGLAREYGAELTMFHVIVPYMGESGDPLDHFPGDRKLEEVFQEQEAAAHGRFEEHLEGDGGRDLEVHRVVTRGFSASNQILDFAKSHDIDLIVMGTHGRRGFNRFLLGSEAERVLRFAPCPVLTISKRAEHVDGVGVLERILLPVDFSPSSDRALEYAMWLAAKHDAVVDMVHVFDEPVVPPFLMDHTGSYISTDPRMKDRCLESMDKDLAAYPREKSRVRKHVLEGRIASTIHDFAEKQESNLIVMGTRGLSGLDYLLLGSAAAHMVRLAPCPVLTVHAEPPEETE
jgi:nucleotide-binding universal stress UspA family protein